MAATGSSGLSVKTFTFNAGVNRPLRDGNCYRTQTGRPVPETEDKEFLSKVEVQRHKMLAHLFETVDPDIVFLQEVADDFTPLEAYRQLERGEITDRQFMEQLPDEPTPEWLDNERYGVCYDKRDCALIYNKERFTLIESECAERMNAVTVELKETATGKVIRAASGHLYGYPLWSNDVREREEGNRELMQIHETLRLKEADLYLIGIDSNAMLGHGRIEQLTASGEYVFDNSDSPTAANIRLLHQHEAIREPQSVKEACARILEKVKERLEALKGTLAVKDKLQKQLSYLKEARQKTDPLSTEELEVLGLGEIGENYDHEEIMALLQTQEEGARAVLADMPSEVDLGRKFERLGIIEGKVVRNDLDMMTEEEHDFIGVFHKDHSHRTYRRISDEFDHSKLDFILASAPQKQVSVSTLIEFPLDDQLNYSDHRPVIDEVVVEEPKSWLSYLWGD